MTSTPAPTKVVSTFITVSLSFITQKLNPEVTLQHPQDKVFLPKTFAILVQ
jgi:hypothetical protein